MYKAFQGANGWYAAWENEEGFHRQGSDTLTESQARKRARELNEQEPESER